MLFVQTITIRYYKDARTPQCAAKRKSVRFCPLPKAYAPNGEVLLHSVFMGQDEHALWTNRESLHCYGEEAFYGGGFNTTPFSGRLAVTREDDTYRIGYCDKRSLGFFTARMRLRPGNTALIASDGVVADPEDSWVKDLLSQEQTDMKRLARTVLREAEALYGAGDDMTVLALRVEERL